MRKLSPWLKLAPAAALVALVSTSGCSKAYFTVDKAPPESPDLSDIPYPRLVDNPAPVPQGVYTAAIPNPDNGLAVRAEMEQAAEEARGKRAELMAVFP